MFSPKGVLFTLMAQDFIRYLASDPKNVWVALWRFWLTIFTILCFALLVRLSVVSQQNAEKIIDVAKAVGAPTP